MIPQIYFSAMQRGPWFDLCVRVNLGGHVVAVVQASQYHTTFRPSTKLIAVDWPPSPEDFALWRQRCKQYRCDLRSRK